MIGKQKTIEKEVSYTGRGLHTGKTTSVVCKPAPADFGVKFVRMDLPQRPVIRVSAGNARYDAHHSRRTILSEGGVEVHTVEHFLAAIAGLGIDNLEIEIDSEELAEPSDGSAAPFVSLLKSGRPIEQDAPKRYFVVNRPVSYCEDSVELLALPYDGLKISFTIEYDNRLVGTQHAAFELNDEIFASEIAPARTFVLLKDVEMLRKKGMIKGGSLDNAIVIEDDHIMNEEPLRFKNEFVRHKILDFIGDLFLLGAPAKGHFVGVKSGHATNVKFVQKLSEMSRQLPEPNVRTGAPKEPLWNVNAIQRIMPHRYPFLLVDRILELEDRKRVVGIKNVTINEPFFAGHFPGHAIMPAVLIIEAMAQAGGVLLLNTVDKPETKLVYFMAIDNAKFRKPVLPGDQLRLELELVKLKARVCKMRGMAFVDGELVAEADLMSQIVDRYPPSSRLCNL
ncbi:MAG: bifunctional UDP-3-O-[3-hydroxymyristoyl] N-acetylglucosamine deacetylase/3-hydroxyacyl-ACP dehydratase [Candidatus Eisenbacteria bacterium]|nr:bifunctional UDP-3-O-[3-hydroxymyristoyl] N-acetylglucosamine deacetylase/3-hydroxyacyl-ACP dehydratase [Candidatus Eisenbacteria bacterium]